MEGPEAVHTVLEEAARLDVPVHRISQGSGVWMLTDAEITEMVAACEAAGVELCLFTGPRGTWDIGGSTRTLSGGAGLRARGQSAVAGCVEDALRATALGVRCLLVADEGVLWLLHRLRADGTLPADTTFKVSALIGPVNPAAVAVHERLGADSVNVPSDLTLEHLTEIRRVTGVPLDFYLEAPDDLGGYVRMYDIAELIRRGGPIYLKFGLSKAPGIYPYGGHLRDVTLATARERVRRGRLALDLLARLGADTGMAEPGSRLPRPLTRFPVPEADRTA
ncbi:U32 family peptidase [Streptomyces sp. RFCAC02]|uniref:U32 family peptidase n=1 Tax=Streptomyces sp. RFCAC02 TaxID=2499143 RepID=UPI001F11309F|nr:U32 family peptidase [Streptomyces sp. RFCAC02]